MTNLEAIQAIREAHKAAVTAHKIVVELGNSTVDQALAADIRSLDHATEAIITKEST